MALRAIAAQTPAVVDMKCGRCAPALTSLSVVYRSQRRRTRRGRLGRWQSAHARRQTSRRALRVRARSRRGPLQCRTVRPRSASSGAKTPSESPTQHRRTWPCCCAPAHMLPVSARRPRGRAPARSLQACTGNTERCHAGLRRRSPGRRGSGSVARESRLPSAVRRQQVGLPVCADADRVPRAPDFGPARDSLSCTQGSTRGVRPRRKAVPPSTS